MVFALAACNTADMYPTYEGYTPQETVPTTTSPDIPTTVPTAPTTVPTAPTTYVTVPPTLPPAANPEDIHIIGDRFFVTQIFEIVFNPEDFLGRTIRYEGMFLSVYWPVTSEYFFLVARPGDDCCGPGDMVGLEVYLNDIPRVDEYTWVEITGVLEEVYAEGHGPILQLNAISMVVVDE